MKIIIYNDIWQKLDNKSLLSYICLIHNKINPMFNSEMYSHLLVGNSSIDKLIRDGIKQLSDLKIIEINDHPSLKNFVIQIGNTEGKYYTCIEFEEVQKIMSADFQINKRLSMLRYFIGLISTFNNSKKNEYYGIGFCSIAYVSEITNINIRSINRYNKDIEDLGLIYIHHSDDMRIVNGHPESITNCYSRPADKDKCIRKAQSFEHTVGVVGKKKAKEEADRKRSETMKPKTTKSRAINNSYTSVEILEERNYDKNTIPINQNTYKRDDSNDEFLKSLENVDIPLGESPSFKIIKNLYDKRNEKYELDEERDMVDNLPF